ncbi:MAG: Ig-like domain-containing protein [Chloroflexota bacterium]
MPRAPIASLARQLRRHRALTRILIAGLPLALAVAVSAGGAAQAGLTTVQLPPPSILPVNVGVGIVTNHSVTVDFATAMDRASVEAGLTIAPAIPLRLQWSEDGRRLTLTPRALWSTDARYSLVVASSARTSTGMKLGLPTRFSFTTQTAPRITDFRLHFVGEPANGAAVHKAETAEATTADATGPPSDTASEVSAGTSLEITFSAAVNRGEVERAFLLSPAMPGIVRWNGATMTFRPIGRFTPDARYAVTLAGVHDLVGNPLAGDASFSFTTVPSAQLVQSAPKAGATGVADTQISLGFSQPVDVAAVGQALRVVDHATGAAVSGSITWNAVHTQLRFVPTRAFAGGHRFDVTLAAGARDADGNPVTASLTFSTRPPPAAPRPRASGSGPAASSTLTGYALNQVNAARAAHGLPPLVLDARISAVSLAHAWDQIRNNYFSHTGSDGSTPQDRLRRAGLSFGWSGENQCYNNNSGRTITGVLNWCHAEFMSEPYPGYANHIGNILGIHYHRVGIGIAVSGAKVVIVWDFVD